VVQLACQNQNLEVLALPLSSWDYKDGNPRCAKAILHGISHPRLTTLFDLANKNSQFRKQSRRRLVIEGRSSNDPDSDSDADDPIEDIHRFHRQLLRF